MEKKQFLPQYTVEFANIWCEVDGLEIPFKLIEAGLSSVRICGEAEEEIVFEKVVKAKLLFKKQEFKMDLKIEKSEPEGQFFIYDLNVTFDIEEDFKKWLIFVKSIFGLYLKKADIK